MKFNEKLKSLRELKGYTQDEIASKLNVARQSVSKWEQGINEPDFETTKKLCQILDCSLTDLIDSDKEIVTSKEQKQDKIAKTIFKFNIGLLLFAILLTFGIVLSASEVVAINWNINGKETLGSRWYILINLIPISVIFLMSVWMKILTKKNERYSNYKIILQTLPLVVSVILIIITIILGVVTLLNYNRGEYTLFNLIIVAFMSIIIAMGPFSHPHFNKRNPIFGFRTNFTLSNEKGWNKVNTFTSFTLTIAGFITYILTLIFIDKDWAVCFVGIIFIAMIPSIIYHEIIRRKIK